MHGADGIRTPARAPEVHPARREGERKPALERNGTSAAARPRAPHARTAATRRRAGGRRARGVAPRSAGPPDGRRLERSSYRRRRARGGGTR